MKNKKLILQHINILRDKPYMIINQIEGYHTYESYLNGFFFGIDLINDFSISNDFSSWVGDYYKVENMNTHWTSFLRIKLNNKTEKDMIEILFKLLNRYYGNCK